MDALQRLTDAAVLVRSRRSVDVGSTMYALLELAMVVPSCRIHRKNILEDVPEAVVLLIMLVHFLAHVDGPAFDLVRDKRSRILVVGHAHPANPSVVVAQCAHHVLVAFRE